MCNVLETHDQGISPFTGKDPPTRCLEVTASSVGISTVFPCDRAVRIDVRSALVVSDLGGLGGLSSSHRKTNSLVRLLSISTGKEAEGQTHVVQVEPIERDPDQPSTDNVPDQGSQDVPTERTSRSVPGLEAETFLGWHRGTHFQMYTATEGLLFNIIPRGMTNMSATTCSNWETTTARPSETKCQLNLLSPDLMRPSQKDL